MNRQCRLPQDDEMTPISYYIYVRLTILVSVRQATGNVIFQKKKDVVERERESREGGGWRQIWGTKREKRVRESSRVPQERKI